MSESAGLAWGVMSSSYPTPDYSHAGRGEFRDVYEPAEDSFLLINALERDAEALRSSKYVKLCETQSIWFLSPVQQSCCGRCLQPGRVCGGGQRVGGRVRVSGISDWTLSLFHVSQTKKQKHKSIVLSESC